MANTGHYMSCMPMWAICHTTCESSQNKSVVVYNPQTYSRLLVYKKFLVIADVTLALNIKPLFILDSKFSPLLCTMYQYSNS